MKNFLVLLVFIAFAMSVSAQKSKDDKIPAEARAGFAAKFSGAKSVKWSVEKPGEFEVDFTLNKVEQSCLLDSKGNLLETEIEVKESDLPQAVKAAIGKDFAGYKLDEITKATDAKGVVAFEMEAVKGKDKLAIEFDPNGKLLSKEPLKEEKEEKEEK